MTISTFQLSFLQVASKHLNFLCLLLYQLLFLHFQSTCFHFVPTCRSDKTPPLLELPHANDEEPQPLVRCSNHMCPIKVHWHVKESYREYWRVKITITNLNFVKNYSQWNLVVLHPNLRNVTQVFSFNYLPLNPYGSISKSNQNHAIINLLLYLKYTWSLNFRPWPILVLEV